MKLDIIAFSAHPDDVELSCGGTIAKMVKAGYKAGVIDLTEAELSTRGTIALRRKETEKASKVLNLSIRDNLKIPDGQIENTLGKVTDLFVHKNKDGTFAMATGKEPDIWPEDEKEE